MDRCIENIDHQIKLNQGKNIFVDKLVFSQFTEEMVKAISTLDNLNPNAKEILIDYATDKVLEEFCRINQYYSFDAKAKTDLRKIYADFQNLNPENPVKPV